MMANGYFLSARKARICRLAGAVFLILAAFTASGIVLVALSPEVTAKCGEFGCEWTSRPLNMLSEAERTKVEASPAALQRFEVYVARPLVRLGLAGVAAVGTAPFAALLLGVGLALRELGGRSGDPLARALPWLRRGCIAAIVWALTAPLHDSLLEILLSPGTPSGRQFVIALNFNSIGVALMLAVAAYATVWALEAGLEAQRDLAEFV